MTFLALIPARYASTRFPGKPLALLGDKPIIQHVYERVASVIPHTYVATDDDRIRTAVEAFGGRVVMTSTHHRSGTDRCQEALQHVVAATGLKVDVVINVQGDEPFIAPSQIKTLQRCFDTPATDIATLVMPFTPEMGRDALFNPNSPKVVIDNDGFALYFSRSVIPYLRGINESEWLNHHTFYRHIGLYAYRTAVLGQITSMPAGRLEIAESLEQLRWLEAGLKIRVGQTTTETIGIDTPEDFARAEVFLRQHA